MYKEGEVDKIVKVLVKDFKLDKLIVVNYIGDKFKKLYKYDKLYYIKKYGLDIYYGDSDDDIYVVREVGVRLIRILRVFNFINLFLLEVGGYGEEVFENLVY